MSLVALPARPFAHAECAGLGLSPWTLRSALEAGRLRRLLRGVYVDATVEDSVALRTAALRLVVEPTQVVVDRTAAWLHGVDTYASAESSHGAPVETCALRGRTRSRLTGVRGRTRDLSASDVTELAGVRVTTPLRTALDLGCHLRRREAYAALCLLARGHSVTVPDLVAGGERFQRRRGVLQLRELAPFVEPRVESHREAWTLLAIHDAGLPLPTPQYWIDVDGVPTFRLDFAYPEHRLYVEYDGHEFHEMTEEQRTYDRERRQWLRAHGWTRIVVRLGDFSGDALERWLRELRAELASAYTSRRW
ncbi:MAG: DUF559 domain-containing protein [Nocardioides sp.]